MLHIFSLAGSRRKSLRNCTKMFCKLYPRGRFLTDTGSPLSHLFLFSLFLSLPRMLLSSSWSCKFFMGFLRGKGVGCLKMPFCKVQDKMSHFFKPQGPLALCSWQSFRLHMKRNWDNPLTRRFRSKCYKVTWKNCTPIELWIQRWDTFIISLHV